MDVLCDAHRAGCGFVVQESLLPNRVDDVEEVSVEIVDEALVAGFVGFDGRRLARECISNAVAYRRQCTVWDRDKRQVTDWEMIPQIRETLIASSDARQE